MMNRDDAWQTVRLINQLVEAHIDLLRVTSAANIDGPDPDHVRRHTRRIDTLRGELVDVLSPVA